MRAFHSGLLEQHGFVHVFSTRHGGVSAAPFDTLNLGFHLGDDDDAVRENRARFARQLGVPSDRLFELRQVHGTQVRRVSLQQPASAFADQEGDALIATDDGVAVAVRTADCVPVLLAHPPSGAVAAVHAGWRGAVAGVVNEGVRALGQDPTEIVAAIGPHIRVGAFEIGEDVADALEEAAADRHVTVRDGAKPHGDLARLVTLQLRREGVSADRIDDVGGCTHTDAESFFSHRRDHGRTGRHLSAIVARAPA